MKLEDFLTLYVDPGEATGWATACGQLLLSAGTEKMWDFADDVHASVVGVNPDAKPMALKPASTIYNSGWLRDEAYEEHLSLPVGRIVCEDFLLYPHELAKHALDWNPVRTARLIGALTLIARVADIPFVLQGAKIKKQAEAAGAEAFFYRPLHENRHQNDAIRHYAYFTHTELI